MSEVLNIDGVKYTLVPGSLLTIDNGIKSLTGNMNKMYGRIVTACDTSLYSVALYSVNDTSHNCFVVSFHDDIQLKGYITHVDVRLNHDTPKYFIIIQHSDLDTHIIEKLLCVSDETSYERNIFLIDHNLDMCYYLPCNNEYIGELLQIEKSIPQYITGEEIHAQYRNNIIKMIMTEQYDRYKFTFSVQTFTHKRYNIVLSFKQTVQRTKCVRSTGMCNNLMCKYHTSLELIDNVINERIKESSYNRFFYEALIGVRNAIIYWRDNIDLEWNARLMIAGLLADAVLMLPTYDQVKNDLRPNFGYLVLAD